MKSNEQIMEEFIKANPLTEKHREGLMKIAKDEDAKKAVKYKAKQDEMRRIFK